MSYEINLASVNDVPASYLYFCLVLRFGLGRRGAEAVTMRVHMREGRIPKQHRAQLHNWLPWQL